MKLLNDRLILRPSSSKMRGLIFVPDQYSTAATTCMIMNLGNKCPSFLKVGDTIMCKVGIGTRKFPINDYGDFFATMDNIYAIFRDKKVYPIGKKILIRRSIADAMQGGVLIPENRRYQSLEGEVIRFGITRKNFRVNDISIGDKIQLTEWEQGMLEVTIEDGSYGLIVEESSLLFKHL